MNVKPEEFVSIREASRGLGRLIERLESGELQKAVIVHRNKPRAVLVVIPSGPHPGDGTLPLYVTHRNVAPGVWLPRVGAGEAAGEETK